LPHISYPEFPGQGVVADSSGSDGARSRRIIRELKKGNPFLCKME
jgi:hypothetical protein